MNISQEALADLEFLIAEDLVKKIKFSTAEHLYITGYCISPKGIKLVENDLKNYLDRLKNALNCDGTVYDLVVNDEDVYYLCEKEGKKKKIPLGCKETEDVSYESTPQLV